MNTTHNQLTCLFGHHDYGAELTKDKYRTSIHLCKICKRSGYYKYRDGFKVWYRYNERGTKIYEKWSDGREWWKANDGYWVDEKPENWKYES